MKPKQIPKSRVSNKGTASKTIEAPSDRSPKTNGKNMANKLAELQQQIEALQQQRDELMAQERAAAIANINTMIATYGIRIRDLSFNEFSKTMTANKPKIAIKYKLGSNAWSGRGRKPKWVEDVLSKGGKLEEILAK